MKKPLLALVIVFTIAITSYSQTNVDAGPLNEVFRQTILVPSAGNLSDPWEVTYGPDDSLWVTEAKGYKVKKISSINGGQRTVLDIGFNATFLPVADRPFNCQFSIGTNNPQGGLMGLAIHPDFYNPTTPKRYIYVAYVHTYVMTVSSPANGGVIYTNRVVRFTYNTSTNKFDSPVALCDTLPGSSDHNSGRLIIAPVGDSMYLFYAAGDMGAGQFGNAYRANKAQEAGPYEGKILRFRLEPDNDPGAYDKWIPSSPGSGGIYQNPYNGVVQPQSAIWAKGIRNNQGFAYGNGKLYGSSHGPFTDDEINWLQAGKNYGHPYVIGDSTDGNYDGAMAGGSASSLPLIGSERLNARGYGTAYANPIMNFYAAPKGNTSTAGTVQYIYSQFNGGNQANGAWPSEGLCGLDYYSNSKIPGWKNSLLVGCLKGGRIMRMNLNAAGTQTVTNSIADTNTLFRSVNRFRDIALSPDGLSVYTVIDSSATTSGPTTNNPIVSACSGCLQKYTFLGYNGDGTANNPSMIPGTIPIAPGVAGSCHVANKVVINAANNNTLIWVPITDTNSNVIAEIYANGNNLDTVRTSFYKNSGTVREDGAKRLYLDRNITITPDQQPASAVRIRLYITTTEFNSIVSAVNSAAQPSGISTISNLGIFKNSNNVCGSTISGGTAAPLSTVIKTTFGSNGYVLQSNNLTSFSSFFFGNAANTSLPVEMLSFTGHLENQGTLLNWATSNEVNSANFIIERSADGTNYSAIGTVAASGNTNTDHNYAYTDNDASNQSVPVLYYRLKIVDIDGQFGYSNVIVINLATIAGKVTVFPNPLATEAKVTIAALADGKAHWKILDNAGRVVMQNSAQVRKGNNNVTINLSKLSAGIYYLSVNGGGVSQEVKLQKL